MEVKESKYIGVKIDPDAFYTTKEAMQILDIKSATTIIDKANSGDLKRSKKGGRVYYKGEWLLEYLEGETV